uniref:Putative heat shock protein 90 n=1 Tax=Fig mild mottle-associated virus TaxID=666641 RepID=D3GBB3_9CLOS|nr:putative heat shock protein 90 [Fig mild mottle-associated virus]
MSLSTQQLQDQASLTPQNWYYGKLFREMLGPRRYAECLLEAESYAPFRVSCNLVEARDYLRPHEVEPYQKYSAKGFINEWALLSEYLRIHNWPEITGLSLYTIMYRIGLFVGPASDVMDLDPQQDCCKYTMSTVAAFLPPSSSELRRYHSWALSNSIGSLTDSTKLAEFKLNSENFEETVEVELPEPTMSDYLYNCLVLCETECVISPSRFLIRKTLFDICVEYFLDSDLGMSSETSYPILTGVILEIMSSQDMFPSSYVTNVKNASYLVREFRLILDAIMQVHYPTPEPDLRVLVPITPVEFMFDLPVYSLYDGVVIMAHGIRRLDRVISDSTFAELFYVIQSVMIKNNSGVDEQMLWVAFVLYYAVYRTAKERVQPRPPSFEARMSNGSPSTLVNFVEVERLFSDLQVKNPTINVRRQFNGKLGPLALNILRSVRPTLTNIAGIILPAKYGYLAIDYYKHVPKSALNEEEASILAQLDRIVDLILGSKLSTISLDKKNSRRKRNPKSRINNYRSRELSAFDDSRFKSATDKLFLKDARSLGSWPQGQTLNQLRTLQLH